MKKQILAIYDIKAKIMKTAFIMDTVTDGIRAFSNLVKSGQNDISDYPQDFTLHQLGTLDMETGAISPAETIQPLANGAEFKRSSIEQEVQA